jgi:hypothetical protein
MELGMKQAHSVAKTYVPLWEPCRAVKDASKQAILKLRCLPSLSNWVQCVFTTREPLPQLRTQRESVYIYSAFICTQSNLYRLPTNTIDSQRSQGGRPRPNQQQSGQAPKSTPIELQPLSKTLSCTQEATRLHNVLWDDFARRLEPRIGLWISAECCPFFLPSGVTHRCYPEMKKHR